MNLMKKFYFLGLTLGILFFIIDESFCFQKPDISPHKDATEELYDMPIVHNINIEKFYTFMSQHSDILLSNDEEKAAQMKELNELVEEGVKFLDVVFEGERWTPGEYRLFSNWDLSCDIYEEKRIRKEFFVSSYETDKFNSNGIDETVMIICPFKLVFGHNSLAEYCLSEGQICDPYRFRIFLSRVCGFRNSIGRITGNWVYATCGNLAEDIEFVKKGRDLLRILDELENTFKNGLFKRGYFYTEMVTFDCCVKNDSPYFNGIDFSKPENIILDDQVFTSIFPEDTDHWTSILEGISDWYITQCAVYESREIRKKEEGQKAEGRNLYNPLFPLVYVLKLAGGDFRNLVGARDALWAIRDRSRTIPTIDWKDEYIGLGSSNAIPSDYPLTVMQQYVLTTIGFTYLKNLDEYIKYTIEDICNSPSLSFVKEYAEEISKRLNKTVSRYKNLDYWPFVHFALFSKSRQNQIMEFLNRTSASAKNSSYSRDFYLLSKFLSAEEIACKIDGEGISSISSESFNDICKSFDIMEVILDIKILPKLKKSASLVEIRKELDWMNEILLTMADDVSKTIGDFITIEPLLCDEVNDYSVRIPGDSYFENEKGLYFSLIRSGKKPTWRAGGFPYNEQISYSSGAVWRARPEHGQPYGVRESLEKVFISPSRARDLDLVWNFYIKEMRIPQREALFRMLLEVGGNYDYISHISRSFFNGSYIARGIFKGNAYLTNDQKYLIARHFHDVLGVSQFYAAAFAYCRNEKEVKEEMWWTSKNMFRQSGIHNFFDGSVRYIIDEDVIISKRYHYERGFPDEGFEPVDCSTASNSLSDLISCIINNYDKAADKSYLSYVASVIGRDYSLESVISNKNSSPVNWNKWGSIIGYCSR